METKILAAAVSAAHIPTFADFLLERQNSRRVPSPGSSTPALSPVGAEFTWPSFYGSQPPADLNKDAFLGQYIHRIYCRECREQEAMAAAASGSGSGSGSQPNSPPQYQMDQMSLATAMDANKEALTRKLMLRRSVNELVDAGIYPSLKAPAAFAEQRIHLERAKTGDILKHKIEQRPARDFLVQHHILEDSNVDPSLASMQRKLKKAKLTDELNEKIANRPGPLELVEQSILEAEDPLKTAIKEGKLEFHKTEQGTDPNNIPKLPYEIDSPKSGHSSPEPTDCDNDSNASSTKSTGFQPIAQVPSPPDITPLIASTQTHTSVTIGGKTLKIPITTQSFAAPQITTFTVAPQAFTTTIQRQPSSFGASRNHRRTAKSNRPSKAQLKPKVIKFHEYKGPPTTKSNNTSVGGQFVTTTGPIQRLEGLTPYQVRVQQQQLYLQCQLEIQSKDSTGAGPSAAVLVPIQAPHTPMIPMPSPAQAAATMLPERQEVSPPRQPDSAHSSRPVTPGLSMKSPSMPQINTQHKTVQLTRSLSQLEDLKVADLKQELKQKGLLVSGTKSQLIERLRNYQLQQEISSANIPSVSSGSGSEFNYSTGIPSVQSYTDDTMMAPPSVMSHRVHSPPPPCSPQHDDIMRSPPPVMSQISSTAAMDTDDKSQIVKCTADIVREQAKQIEDLQRQLSQLQQQLPPAGHPTIAAPPSVAPKTEDVSQPTSPTHIHLPQPQTINNKPTLPAQTKLAPHMQQLQQQFQTHSQQQTPVDITDKQVYLATPDGKMTAYKVILHTGNGVVHPQQTANRDEPAAKQTQPRISSTSGNVVNQTSSAQSVQAQINIPVSTANVDIAPITMSQLQRESVPSHSEPSDRTSQGINVEDVLEVLIRTGEMDPAMLNGTPSPSIVDNSQTNQPPSISDQISLGSPQAHSLGINNQAELEPQEALSPLPSMDWMDEDHSDSLDLEGLDEDPRPPIDTTNGLMFNDDNASLDWLSDIMQLDSDPNPSIQQQHFINSRENECSTSDPILTPRPQDVMSIFHLDDTEFRPEPMSSLYWDKFASQQL